MSLLFFSVTKILRCTNFGTLLNFFWIKAKQIGVGVLKGVQMGLCGIECANPKNNTIKTLGIHFSYNRRLENDENYRRYIIKIEKLLISWRM